MQSPVFVIAAVPGYRRRLADGPAWAQELAVTIFVLPETQGLSPEVLSARVG
jgi:hypothetical protein